MDPSGKLYWTCKRLARRCGHLAFVGHTGSGRVRCLTCGATAYAWPIEQGGW